MIDTESFRYISLKKLALWLLLGLTPYYLYAQWSSCAQKNCSSEISPFWRSFAIFKFFFLREMVIKQIGTILSVLLVISLICFDVINTPTFNRYFDKLSSSEITSVFEAFALLIFVLLYFVSYLWIFIILFFQYQVNQKTEKKVGLKFINDKSVKYKWGFYLIYLFSISSLFFSVMSTLNLLN
ncbi:MAG: hypothetical protein HRT47_13600 [Candidatus Caenarcaniphilales bacterium]|nr:hypothetical protein [Candidatus Caenarcaniphilales bacterium]